MDITDEQQNTHVPRRSILASAPMHPRCNCRGPHRPHSLSFLKPTVAYIAPAPSRTLPMLDCSQIIQRYQRCLWTSTWPSTCRASNDLRKQTLKSSLGCGGGLSPVTEGSPIAVSESNHDASASAALMLPPAAMARSSKPPPQISSWDKYFDEKLQVEVPGRGSFNTYVAGSTGPVVLCIHGGGYTGLTWALVAQRLKDKYRVVAPDMRGHGDTVTTDDADYSKQTMAADIAAVWSQLYGSSDTTVPVVLVGHSMGGALVVWAAELGSIKGIAGVVVVDVVEGTALAALPHMGTVIANRPGSFASPEAAVAWALSSGMCHSKEAAGASLPSQLRLATTTVGTTAKLKDPASDSCPAQDMSAIDSTTDHTTDTAVPAGASEAAASSGWVWRTPLLVSQPYWQGWYSGLSEAYLKLPHPKLLLLAGTDRLDRVLTIGQMQGKFQLVLLPQAGHAVQEDEATKTAEALSTFLHRFRVGEPPMQLPKQVGVQRVLPTVAGPTL